MTKIYAIGFAAVAAIALVIMGGLAFWSDGKACTTSVVAGGKATIGGPFSLVDQNGTAVTDKDVITGLTLIYFGYTYCPDICPLDTQRNLDAVDILDEQGLEIKPVFITIDPARDTVEALNDYAAASHPRLVALTGTQEQIKAASKAYRTFFRKSGEGDDYLMDHSTQSYLMDATGFLQFFRRDTSPEEMAKTITCFASV
jgi:protein SCO1/2